MDGAFRLLIILFVYSAVFDAPGKVNALVPAEEDSESFPEGVTRLINSSSNTQLEGGRGFDQPSSSIVSNIEPLNNNNSVEISGTVTDTDAGTQLGNESVSGISDEKLNGVNISEENISDINGETIIAYNTSSYINNINLNSTVNPVLNVNGAEKNKTVELIDGNKVISGNSSTVVINGNIVNDEKLSNSNSSKSSYTNTTNSVTAIKNNDIPPTIDIEDDDNDNSQPRGDMDPLDIVEDVEDDIIVPVAAENTQRNFTAYADILSMDRSFLYSTMSWLDIFMLEHRGILWIVFNTLFMILWILIGGFSLYRLLGLPYCSPYISRTKYLVIHLLIFTAATFEFVQLIHFSYGSHEGLPLFLTLLLTHTPTPCLAAALILMVYCVFVAARVPIFIRYLPPIIYVSILISFIIVLSFVGDIIVGVTRNSIFLIVCRGSLLVLCLICSFAFIISYRKIVGVALLMRREFRGELKALAIPVDSIEESQDASLHLKRILITWTRMTLLSCVSGIFMCIFSFCLSLFFTVSAVPLWAFWVLHTGIFVAQVLVVFSITFGATYTLSYNNRENIFRKYFLPSFLSNGSTNRSFIKRGNFIYQRVSVANGPSVTPTSVPPTIMENVEHSFLPNNNLITDLSASPFRSKVNLKRSATFNCSSPYYGFHRSPCAPFTPNLYPVLSDHILPYSQSQPYPNFNRQDMTNTAYSRSYNKTMLQYSNSFSHNIPNRARENANYGHRNPMKSFHTKDRFVDLDSISKGSYQKEDANRSLSENASNPLNMAGTVEPLEVAYAPINIIPIMGTDQNSIRQISDNYSFNTSDRLHFKQGPPEKPARRTEPILVKGVMKDNVYLKSTFPVSESLYTDKQVDSYSTKDSNRYPDSSYYAYRDKSPMHNVIISPGLNSCLESTNTSTPIPISKTSFSTASPTVSPISSRCEGAIYSPYDLNVSPNYSLNSGHSNSFLGSKSHVNGARMTVLKDLEEPLPEVHPLIDKPETADLSIADLSVSADDTHVSTDSSPIPKRHSLRRNHSTAGEFSARGKGIDTEDESTSGGDFPEAVNGFKHPWYGTWGGRRKSKRKSSANIQDTTSTSTLRRLSASKSSLSSIYEKLKPKRNKASYRQAQTADDCHDPSSETNENSSISHEEVEVEVDAVAEEEEFLPRLDEDIDLTSDILRSSTVLADFYSLDRSYLKKRKKAQMGLQEEDAEEGYEMNGIDNGEGINTHDQLMNGTHIDDKT